MATNLWTGMPPFAPAARSRRAGSRARCRHSPRRIGADQVGDQRAARTARRGAASPRRPRRAGAPPGSTSSGCRRSRRCAGARSRAAAACVRARRCSSVDLSSTRMISSTQSRGIAETVRSSVRAAFQAGITTITLPAGAATRADAAVQARRTYSRRSRRAAAPLDDRAASATRQQRRGRASAAARSRALSGRLRAAGRRTASYRLGCPGRHPTKPCSHPNMTWPPRSVAHPFDQ